MSERELRGLHLHLDCASGAAGDMFLGALLDLGVPVEVIGQALDAIGAGRQRLRIARVMKRGIASVDVKVDTSGHVLDEHRHEHGRAPHTHGPAGHLPHSVLPKPRRATTQSGHSGSFVAIKFREESHERHVHVDELGGKVEEVLDHSVPPPPHAHPHTHPHAHPHPHPHPHDHSHAQNGQGHGEHAHYHYGAIRERLVRAPLGDGVRARALDIFDRLARAEAKLHGTTVEQVTFHEVGAIDSIVDVVGTAAAIDWLSPVSVSCASVAMGHGTLNCAHGVLPVPAPAALEVLREAGGITADGGVATELCTPTGAAILASIVTSWAAAPTGRPVAVGWGAGDTELADRANVLRIVAMGAARSEPVALSSDKVWQVDANIDDMSPELAGAASEALFAAGALDVWWTPITMKKGRPAVTLSVLAEATTRDAVIAAMLRETTTIGVRYAELSRTVLNRSIVEVDTRYGRIPVKIASDGQAVRNVAPEYEACAVAARSHGVPVKLVLAAALAAYDSRR
ncbi:MAG: nickel pincer cofactor biosynthesis protein LarC [Kofleriaceae bacterium]|nr:nickel pincer cofactor biosynthesis protein LarC [Kofleriaceae bacterium]